MEGNMTTAPIKISKKQFWTNVNVLPPLIRLGFSDGPGAFMCSEPCDLRQCAIKGVMDYAYTVSVVLKGPRGGSHFFQYDEPMTLNEFMAMCRNAMPDVGICSGRYGEKLLDEDGNVRSDLDYPVRRLW
jgi:hypothetical protein